MLFNSNLNTPKSLIIILLFSGQTKLLDRFHVLLHFLLVCLNCHRCFFIPHFPLFLAQFFPFHWYHCVQCRVINLRSFYIYSSLLSCWIADMRMVVSFARLDDNSCLPCSVSSSLTSSFILSRYHYINYFCHNYKIT